MNAWRFITAFGTVSMLADVVYEGARSITGPLLASLGATALVVGVVTGIGEAAALALRLLSGPLTDRTQQFWAWTIAGYALTVITVPLLGVAGTLWVACTLVIAERVGKAVRSPAKDTLLSHAAHVTGRGKGFAVHEALDQIGAVIGPLVVAGVLATTGGNYGPALGVLALPGVAAIALVVWLCIRVPEPARYEPESAAVTPTQSDAQTLSAARAKTPLPPAFWTYCGFTALTLLGFATFGVLSFHMVNRHIFSAATVPVVYAVAMAAAAVAALASGWLYDHFGSRTMATLPIVAALIPVVAFTESPALVVVGSALWGAAMGIQESTMRAVVADLVAPQRRATAYGIYAAGLGAATAAGGALTGFLYETSTTAVIATVAALQLSALCVGTAAGMFKRAAS